MCDHNIDWPGWHQEPANITEKDWARKWDKRGEGVSVPKPKEEQVSQRAELSTWVQRCRELEESGALTCSVGLSGMGVTQDLNERCVLE